MALESWLLLEPRPQILLIVDHPSTEKLAQEYGVEFTPCLEFSPRGVPLLSSVFREAQRLAKYKVMAYVNADILLPNKLGKVIEKVKEKWKRFMIVSAPTIIDYTRLHISLGYEQEAMKHAIFHPIHTGADLFIYTKGIFTDIPPIRLGRYYWDHWLLSYPLIYGVPVIDATPYLPIFHPYDKTSSQCNQTGFFERFPLEHKLDAEDNLRLIGYWFLSSREQLPYYIDSTGQLHSRLKGGMWKLQVKFMLKYTLHSLIKGQRPLREKINPLYWITRRA
ncbi:MAG: hypothetical protein RMK98_07880 [Bacteroidia bacterium]|nr:hypothetical protein [Bacteroidia bacterium]